MPNQSAKLCEPVGTANDRVARTTERWPRRRDAECGQCGTAADPINGSCAAGGTRPCNCHTVARLDSGEYCGAIVRKSGSTSSEENEDGFGKHGSVSDSNLRRNLPHTSDARLLLSVHGFLENFRAAGSTVLKRTHQALWNKCECITSPSPWEGRAWLAFRQQRGEGYDLL